MKKSIFFIFFFTFFTLHTYASSKISFIDINYIIEKSNAGSQITEILKKKRNSETQKLEVKKNQIKKKEDEFKSKSMEKDFNEKKTKYINDLLKEINQIMIAYIEKNSIDIVVKKENLVTGRKELDITKIILDELNKKKNNY